MSEQNNIESFDPSKLMQGVKDRIKATFISLIPDDRWDELVKHEVDDFFAKKDKYYSDRNSISDFQKVVNECLTEETKKRVKEYLDTLTNSYWDGKKNVINDNLKKIIVDNADEIIARVMGEMIRMTLQNMKNY